eukprot:gene4668-5114_t
MDNQGLHEAILATEKLRANYKQEQYSFLRNEREKATFSMMMKMNPEALTNIRKEFFARKDSVTLDEFVYLISKHLLNKKGDDRFVMETPEQREFGTNMYELFKDIDVNGDKLLEWQEFTSFTVEKANLLNKRAKLASIAHYHDSSANLDASAKYRHRHDISKFVNIPSIGQFAMVEDHKNAIFVFNSRLGKHVATITTEAAPISIESIPDKDKQLVVTSGADMTLATYSLDDPNPKRRYKVHSTWATPGVQMALAYSRDSSVLYSGATNGNIYSWNWQQRSLLTTLAGHTDIVMNLIVLQKLNNIASASLDKTLGIWDSHTNEQILKLVGHRKGVFDLTYNPSYRLIFSCGFEHDACVWSPFVNSMVYRLKGHHASLVGVQTVENSPEVITADTSGVFKLWDVRNFQCVQTFSVNLNGQDSKDNSKLTCFFHTKLPSSNTFQREDDSRVYAASKMLFSFDQARVVHEATTDYTNVFWVSFNEGNCCIITASDYNVIVWDALVGSKKFFHSNICGEEISACALDDRKRKILIGDVSGKIGVYNYSSGALMKTVHHAQPSVVVAIEYYDEGKRFIAGYANGMMCVFDENVLEECHLIRTFEHLNRHNELQSLNFSPYDLTVATCGVDGEVVRLWDYNSGKCDTELKLNKASGAQIVHVALLLPRPLVATSDSYGNVIIWGSRGIRWQGLRIAAFLNQTPVYADYEPRHRYAEEDEEAPRRAIPPLTATVYQSTTSFETNSSKSALPSPSASLLELRKSINMDMQPPPSRQRGLRSSFTMSPGYLDRIRYESSRREAQELLDQSERKWGKVAPAQSICWNNEQNLLFAGDDMGYLRCFDLTDVMEDLRVDQLSPEQFQHKTVGLCRSQARDDHSALPPVPDDISIHEDDFEAGALHYLLGVPGSATAYLGVKFRWTLFAHHDRVISCTNIGNNGIMTSAADRLVKMWTYDGKPLGTLLQSVPVGVRSRSWELIMDVDAIIEQEQKELDEIISKAQQVAQDPNKPDITTMDFTGMQLGAQSAEFSRSVLRQRIEKSTRILGLDFPHSKMEADEKRRIGLSEDSFASVEGLSVASSNNKSIFDALKEIKSTESAVDYDMKTKQMSLIQQKRKANKLMAISQAYEAKTGVQVKSTSSKEPWQQNEGDEKLHVDLDKLLTAADPKESQDEASVNKDMYSVDSLSQASGQHENKTPSPVRTKLLQTIREVHEKGARTIYMRESCRKFATFRALDEAIQQSASASALALTGSKRTISASPSPKDIAELRSAREKKHSEIFRRVTSARLDGLAKLGLSTSEKRLGVISRAPSSKFDSLASEESLDSVAVEAASDAIAQLSMKRSLESL